MSRIDPKWISYDDGTLTIIDDNGNNLLSLNVVDGGGINVTVDGIEVDLNQASANNNQQLVADLNTEYQNDVRMEVRKATEGEPTADNSNGRDSSKDFWIGIPDSV